jgi:hypothetical protein
VGAGFRWNNVGIFGTFFLLFFLVNNEEGKKEAPEQQYNSSSRIVTKANSAIEFIVVESIEIRGAHQAIQALLSYASLVLR